MDASSLVPGRFGQVDAPEQLKCPIDRVCSQVSLQKYSQVSHSLSLSLCFIYFGHVPACISRCWDNDGRCQECAPGSQFRESGPNM